jgi:hypothetical protein
MAKHPVQDAWSSGAAGGIADAEEQYFASVFFSVAAITARQLERTKFLVLVIGASVSFYQYDPTNTDTPDDDNVIHDTDDRPFVKLGSVDTLQSTELSEFTSAGALTVGASARGYRINRDTPETAAIYFPADADRNGVPITIADAAGNFETYPQTVHFDGTETARGASTFVLDSNWQVTTFYPQGDGTWIIG